MNCMIEQIVELYEIYNYLGEDLVLLDAMATVKRAGHPLPDEYVASCSQRLLDYIEQHTGEIQHLARYVCKSP